MPKNCTIKQLWIKQCIFLLLLSQFRYLKMRVYKHPIFASKGWALAHIPLEMLTKLPLYVGGLLGCSQKRFYNSHWKFWEWFIALSPRTVSRCSFGLHTVLSGILISVTCYKLMVPIQSGPCTRIYNPVACQNWALLCTATNGERYAAEAQKASKVPLIWHWSRMYTGRGSNRSYWKGTGGIRRENWIWWQLHTTYFSLNFSAHPTPWLSSDLHQLYSWMPPGNWAVYWFFCRLSNAHHHHSM